MDIQQVNWERVAEDYALILDAEDQTLNCEPHEFQDVCRNNVNAVKQVIGVHPNIEYILATLAYAMTELKGYKEREALAEQLVQKLFGGDEEQKDSNAGTSES